MAPAHIPAPQPVVNPIRNPLKERADELPQGEEFKTLCSKFESGEIEERVKIAVAAKYFAAYMEEEYGEISKRIHPKDPEDIALHSNQQLMVHLIRYSRTYDKKHFMAAAEIAAKTEVMPPAKALLMLFREDPKEEMLCQGYMLDRDSTFQAMIKSVLLSVSGKHKEAQMIIAHIPNRQTSGVALLRLAYAIGQKDIKEAQKAYSDYTHAAVTEEESIEQLPPSARRPALDHLGTKTEYANRLVQQGTGIGPDKIIGELRASLKSKSVGVPVSPKDMLEKHVENPEFALDLLHVSRRVHLEVELIRAEDLAAKQMDAEAHAVAQSLKKNFVGISETTDERIALLLLHTHLRLKHEREMDVAFIAQALSKRDTTRKETDFAEFVSLMKKEQPIPPEYTEQALSWTEKMMGLTKSSLSWAVKMDMGKYLNRVGCVCFALKRIEKAEQAFRSALEVAEEADRESITENLHTLEEYTKRKDASPNTAPECSIIFNAVSAPASDVDPVQYLQSTTGAKTETQVADQLEEVYKVILQQEEAKEGSAVLDRLVGIISLCSLLKYRKQILTLSEILASSVSVIYNHVLFWCSEEESIPYEVVSFCLELLRAPWTSPAEKILARKACFLALQQSIRDGDPQKVKDLAAELRAPLSAEISCLRDSPQEADILVQVDAFNEEQKAIQMEEEKIHARIQKEKEKLAAAKSRADRRVCTSKDALAVSELAQKRDELLKMLINPEPEPRKKEKGKGKRAPRSNGSEDGPNGKKTSAPPRDKDTIPKRQRKKKQEAEEGKEAGIANAKLEPQVPASEEQEKEEDSHDKKAPRIKRKHQTVISSDEEEDLPDPAKKSRK